MKRTIINWSLVILWSSAIFYLSSTPIVSPVTIEYIDFVYHAFFYAVFAFLLSNAVRFGKRAREKTFLTAVIAIATVYGAAMEWYQMYVPTRTASFSDIVANMAGAFIGAAAYIVIYKWRRRSCR